MKRFILISVMLLLVVGMLFGCTAKNAAIEPSAAYYGGAYDDYDYDYDYNYAVEVTSADAPMEAVGDAAKTSYTGTAQALPETSTQSDLLANRKIIRNAKISVQTLEFDKFIENLDAAVNNVGGFIESSNVGGREYYSSRSLRSATYVIRIPAASLDAFLNTVDGLGNVTSLNTNMRDVTTNYVDSQKHLEALRAEQEALLEILKSATTVEDIITVQDRLSYVKYEIESYESILRTYDDQVDLSTVTLNLYEVEHETVVEPETFWQEVTRRFNNSLENVGDGFRNFSAWLLGNAPEIIVFLVFNGVIVLIVVLSVRGGIKRRRKRREKKLAEAAAKEAQPKA